MRSVPVQSRAAAPTATPSRRLAPIRGVFFAPEPLVILFPRRFRAPPPLSPWPLSRLRRRRILIGNLYRTTRFSHSSSSFSYSSISCTFSFETLLHPLVSANGLSRGSGYGNGWRRWSLRVSGSFCFCSAFHRGIGNAYFITPRCLAGRALFVAPSAPCLASFPGPG